MNIPDYSQYAFEDFVLDADFRAWVLSPDNENNSFWQELIEIHPEKANIINDAIKTVQRLSFNKDEISTESKERIWKVLENKFEEKEESVIKFYPVSQSKRFYWIAATLTALLISIGAFLFYSSQPHELKILTAFGEVKNITLPDGSEVILNGNSSFTYFDKWQHEENREVWLEGEAYFKVSKITSVKKGRIKFITHTPQLDISVLGTQYNVNARRGKTKVMLIEGKIQLKTHSNNSPKVVEMKPGEFATSEANIAKADVFKARPELYDAWTRRQFVFENTPLSEVAALLEDTYGLKLIFDDSKIADYRLTANIPNENVETLLSVIEATFNLEVEHNNKQIYFHRK